MKPMNPSLVHFLNAAVVTMTGALDLFAVASQLPSNEYIPNHPTGCHYVRKNTEGKFSFVQTCSRGPAGEWEQVIEALDLATPGVIYIPRQTLVNGIDVEGYWCSGAAPRAFRDEFQNCTKVGWQKSTESP
jgi:hypothetical protein